MPKCTHHEWVYVDHGTHTSIRCANCQEKPPPDKRVIRLRTEYREAKCPKGKGVQKLHNCYLNALTPGHPCEGCKHVKKLRKRHGLRTYDVVATEHYTRGGILHQEFPLRILYSALDRDGKSWMAVNAFTGQRQRVTLHAEYPHRRNDEGEDIEREYSRKHYEMRGAMYTQVGISDPPWNGVPSRDEWHCTCLNCRQGGYVPMKTIKEYKDNEPTVKHPGIDPRRTLSGKPVPVYGDLYCTECQDNQDQGGCDAHRDPNIKVLPTRNGGTTVMNMYSSAKVTPTSSAGSKPKTYTPVTNISKKKLAEKPKQKEQQVETAASVISKKVAKAAAKKGKSK